MRESDFINTPKIEVLGKGHFRCPVCKKEWIKEGRGIGFVYRGARKHVYSCFVKSLSSIGLKMGVYDMDKLAFPLEKIK